MIVRTRIPGSCKGGVDDHHGDVAERHARRRQRHMPQTVTGASPAPAGVSRRKIFSSHIRSGARSKPHLHGVVQMPRHHLGVDRVGDPRRAVGVQGHQPQVVDVGDVLRRPGGLGRPGQDRLHHPSDPVLAQLVRQAACSPDRRCGCRGAVSTVPGRPECRPPQSGGCGRAPLVADEAEQLVQIHAVERRGCSSGRPNGRALGVEEAHERVVATARAVPGRRHGIIAHGGRTGVVRGDFDTGVSTGCTAGDAQRASVLHWPACRSR